jgi:hypothetical protein
LDENAGFTGDLEPREPDDEYLRQLDRLARAGERVLWVMLTGTAIATLVLGVASMLAIGGGRSHLGGRLMVAVVAIFVLGALDTQATRLAKRRRPLLAPDPPEYRRFVIWSAIGLASAVVLFVSLALYLP